MNSSTFNSQNDVTMLDEENTVPEDESRKQFEQNLLNVFLHANEQTLSDSTSGGYDELLNVMEDDTKQNKARVFHIQESGLSNPVAFLEEHNPSSNIDEEVEKIIHSPDTDAETSTNPFSESIQQDTSSNANQS